MVGGRHCGPGPAPADRRSGRPGRGLFPQAKAPAGTTATAAPHSGTKPGSSSRQRAQILGVGETGEIVRCELRNEVPEQRRGAEMAEIGVEVAVNRHELAHVDPGGFCAFVEPLRCLDTGRVVVAGDIEARSNETPIFVA